MSSLRNRLLGIATALIFCPAALTASTVIYLDDFSGSLSTPLNGTAPDTRNSIAGGSSSATWTSLNTTWKADGSVNNTQSTAYLPFTPQSGLVYTLSLNVTVTNQNVDWLAAGFTTSGMVLGEVIFAYEVPAMLLRGAPAGNGTNVQAFPKGVVVNPPNGTSAYFDAGTPPHGVFSMTLDTTASFWKVDWFFNGNNFKSFTYSGGNPNPSITGIGISSFASGAGSVDNLSLTVVPETSHAFIGILVGSGLLQRYRRRTLL